ncbi:MAG: hypothetical protein U0031_21135 [Thermomicrobiales bacterium]
MAKRSAGRATRQILSGSELGPIPDTVGGHDPARERISPTMAYFLVLSGLVILAALLWALWGMAPATPVILVLSVGLLAAWILL